MWIYCGRSQLKGKAAELWFVAEGNGKTVLGVTGTQLLWIYVDKIQATVAKWEALWPIFDVFARDKDYERGGDTEGAVVEEVGSR